MAAASSIAEPAAEGREPLVVCLAGNPNVGKSSLFNRLVGAEAETANYPGITVEAAVAHGTWDGREVEVVDLPGTYALGSRSEDEKLAWQFLLSRRPDVVVAVVDATNLARNLYVVLQLIDFGFNVVVALNLVDEARRRSLTVDGRRLSSELGVPVVSTVGVSGEGIDALKWSVGDVAGWAGGERGTRRVYSDDVEAELARLASLLDSCTLQQSDSPEVLCGLSPRAAAFVALEGLGVTSSLDVVAALGASLDGTCSPDDGPQRTHGGGLALHLVAERHAAAGAIAAKCARGGHKVTADVIWRLATTPRTGVPLLVVVLGTVFAILFVVGGWLSSGLTWLWVAGPSPVITRGVHAVLGTGAVGDTILWGVNGGVFATLAVGIPYIATFYMMMALLEDTGYVSAAAYLADPLMHRFGLHGRAVIPLIAAGGCNVPAIMGVRVLTSRRERLIASTLATIVPCSARTAVIVGAVSLYAGWGWALAVYAVVLVVGVVAGVGLNRLLPGETGGMVMEMFPLRKPSLLLILRKTWARLRSFVWVAAPVILGGSLLLGALYETGAVWHLAQPLSPVVEWWLGLPAVAGLTLLFAVLRKELALQLLVVFAVVRYGVGGHDLSRFMTTGQIVVYALVSTLYIPCASTIAVLGRELGWKAAAGISAGTLAVALLIGGIAARLFALA